jgi:hypothetical protein
MQYGAWTSVGSAVVVLLAGALVSGVVALYLHEAKPRRRLPIGAVGLVIFVFGTFLAEKAVNTSSDVNRPAERGSSAVIRTAPPSEPAPSVKPPTANRPEPIPPTATAQNGPPNLPARIQVSCKWHRSDKDLAAFVSCSHSIRSSEYLARVRVSFNGLDLRRWHFLQAPDNGSWQVQAEANGDSTTSIIGGNENNLREDQNGTLVGDNPATPLYVDLLVDPNSDIPETVHLRLFSGDNANLGRTMELRLK